MRVPLEYLQVKGGYFTNLLSSPNVADKIVKCICVLHRTVIDSEGLDEASLLEL